jgi:ABC-type Fe3+ transport system permease subunit
MLISTKSGLGKKFLDFFLLAAVGLPGIVFAIGYIFAYNLPLAQKYGFHLYGTVALLGSRLYCNCATFNNSKPCGKYESIPGIPLRGLPRSWF